MAWPLPSNSVREGDMSLAHYNLRLDQFLVHTVSYGFTLSHVACMFALLLGWKISPGTM